MSPSSSLRSLSDLDFTDIGVALLSLAAPVGTVFAQFFWIVVFDETGLDVLVPDGLFVTVLPALTIALIPAGVGWYVYTRRRALIVGGLVFVASAALSLLTIQFFRLCGPGC